MFWAGDQDRENGVIIRLEGRRSGVWRRLVTMGLVVGVLSACSQLPLFETTQGDEPQTQTRDQGPFQPPQLKVAAYEASSLKMAYRSQTSKVKEALAGRAPSGFKAGLTTRESQQRFGMNSPISGVLWPDTGLVFNGDMTDIQRHDFRKPMLEMELAFRINTLIPEPLADVSEVQFVVSEIMPALELPDLGFDSEVGVTGESIVAANAGASYYVLGAPISVEQVDVNAVQAKLYHDGELNQRGEATQVMGNQWRALFWLINSLVEQGWVLQPGQVLLSGAMGEMIPIETGVYEARFSGLGEVRIQVE